MVIGDTHGNQKSIVPKIKLAGELGIQKVLQVGDFGLWDHLFDGVQFVDAVNEAAGKAKLTVHAIGGNHENWDHWYWYTDNLPTSHGWAMLRSRVALAPKVHSWTWNHRTFVAAGGAVSVDKEWRLKNEVGGYDGARGRYVRGTGERTLYWPNETLTDEELLKAKGFAGTKVDYLITHDCSNKTPWNGRLKADVDSEQHRRKIDKILLATAPGMHFHGHMHTKYDWLNFVGERNGEAIYVQTYGLECDTDYYSYGILDTDTNKFTWRHDEVA